MSPKTSKTQDKKNNAFGFGFIAGVLAACAIVACLFFCSGCDVRSSDNGDDSLDDADVQESFQIDRERFTASSFVLTGHSTRAQVVVDNETGVQYLLLRQGYGGGVTVLVDENGDPLLADGYANGADTALVIDDFDDLPDNADDADADTTEILGEYDAEE